MSTHKAGQCAMRGSCGTKYQKSLPCPDNDPARELESADDRELLTSVCGEEFAHGPVCCSSEQIVTMQEQFQQAYKLIFSCPACRNNFRTLFCKFTCSPDQSLFLNVTETQIIGSEEPLEAVKSVQYAVSEEFGKGFYESCKNVQFTATNGFAIDLMAPGATNYTDFLQGLGKEEPLRSPFRIDFPVSNLGGLVPMSSKPRNCSDASDLSSLCPCVHCPDSCSTLPALEPPGSQQGCHVGSLSCLSFTLILAYGVTTLVYIFGLSLQALVQRRRRERQDRMALLHEGTADNLLSPISRTRRLVGTSSLTPYSDGDDTTTGFSETHHLGRGASLLDPEDNLQPRQYHLNTLLRRAFFRLGFFCAKRIFITFSLFFICCAVLISGWKHFGVETDPVRLWVAPNSESRIEKEFFDTNFGPFYRTEQIFATPLDGELALDFERLRWWVQLDLDIRSLRSETNGVSLQDVCFKPTGSRGDCLVQSIGIWFGSDVDRIKPEKWKDTIRLCSAEPGNMACLPSYQMPLQPQFVLGGIPNGAGLKDSRYLHSKALVMTYVLNDSLNAATREKAAEWETALKVFLENTSSHSGSMFSTTLAYSTGVSLEEEINKSTNTDIKTVILSYIAMFAYISITLGASSPNRGLPSLQKVLRTFRGYSGPNETPPVSRYQFFTRSRATLGLFGILLVLLSIASSVGLFSYLSIKSTLIIAEVIPFLVLAVGVDNIFILVHELDRQGASLPVDHLSQSLVSPTASMNIVGETTRASEDETGSSYVSPEERIARTLAKMGPSILLSSLTQVIAFALGAVVPMPAVRNFAIYAAGSVFFNAVFQLTVFVSCLSLDLRRREANRVDCFPCIRLSRSVQLQEPGSSASNFLSLFFKTQYAPFLLRKSTKTAVVIIFTGMAVLSAISVQNIQLGLDQRLALPSDSHLVPYFDALDNLLEVGPPVYFVVKGDGITDRSVQQRHCSGFSTCSQNSVSNLLEAERKRPDVSFFNLPSTSWIDDFLNWLNPEFDACCRVRVSDPKIFCGARGGRCQPCYQDREPPWNITMEGFPTGEEFMTYLNHWLKSPTTDDCPLAGQSSYGASLSLSEDGDRLLASHFRTYNIPLKSQSDFINAFQAGHRVAAEIREATDLDVFPYSPFYVFFDQYAHIVTIAQEVLGLGLASTLIVTSLLLGSWRTGLIVTAVVALTVLNVMGMMVVEGVSLNALSLVNLVISLGIAVEFSAHIARAFMGAGTGLINDHPAGQKERDERVWLSLVDVGPSVLSGITFTKLIGMVVLAFTKSRLLEIYYFRMWMTLIVSGALHGLVLLPVVLSLAGGRGYALEDEDEEWLTRISRRHPYEYRPFRDDDQDSLSSS